MTLSNLTVKALSGTSFTPESHPVLLDLLELAHAPPFGPTRAQRMLLSRQNQQLRTLIQALDRAKLEDQQLLKLGPFHDLEWGEDQWRFTGRDSLDQRKAVLLALRLVLASLKTTLKVVPFHDLKGLRRARALNNLPEIEQELSPLQIVRPIRHKGQTITSLMLTGNRLLARLRVFDFTLHFLVQADEYGKLHVLTLGRKAVHVLDWHDQHPAK